MLSVIIPIFNEQETLHQLLSQVTEERTLKEIILVDDGSNDRSDELIAHWFQHDKVIKQHIYRVIWLKHQWNMGKGSAIRTGLHASLGEYVIVQDADLEVLPADYPNLLHPLLSNQTEFVIGARIYPATNILPLHRLGVQFLNRVVRLLYGYRISDSACCFKLLKRSHLLKMSLQCRRFEFCPEVIAKASRMGLKFQEVPVSYCPRTTMDGKKLNLLQDGMHALLTLIRFYSWSPRNPPTQLISEDQTNSMSGPN